MGWVGLEPTTNALKGRCSTIELPTRRDDKFSRFDGGINIESSINFLRISVAGGVPDAFDRHRKNVTKNRLFSCADRADATLA